MHKLTAQDLLAGGSVTHEIEVPEGILKPGSTGQEDPRAVRLRPLSVGTLALISRAARDDAALIPLLMIKESMTEPAVTLEQIRMMHVGLVYFLIEQINRISGLGPDGQALEDAASAILGKSHILLARHFGWTPEQVAQLTPAQVGVYLAGIEKLLAMDSRST